MRSHWQTIIILLLVGTTGLTFATAQSSRRVLDEVRISPPIGDQMPLDIELLDHSGQPTTLRKVLDGKPAVLCFVYFECPMLCKLAADGLVRSLSDIDAEVGKDFQAVIISFDPHDTPEQAALSRAQLVRRYGHDDIGGGWCCLTGQEKQLKQMTARFGFHYVWDAETSQYAHAAGVFLVSQDGILTDCLSGVEFTPTALAAGIESARLGIVNQQTADNADSAAFLRCYLYDPTTGRFGSIVQWTVRVLGIGTVIAMVCGVRNLVRRSKPGTAVAPTEPESRETEWRTSD